MLSTACINLSFCSFPLRSPNLFLFSLIYFIFLPFLYLPLSWNMLVICIIFCSLDKTISILELASSDIEVLISNFWSCFIYIPEDLWPMSGFIFKPQSVAWFIPIIIVSPLSSPSLWFLTAFCAGYMSYIISLSVCISHQCLWGITLYSSKKVNGAHLFSLQQHPGKC